MGQPLCERRDSARDKAQSKGRTEEMNVVLVGFMGAGKSTVAALLQKKTGWPLIELDEEIVRAEGRSIPDIFREDGEEGFRRVETRELKKALSGENAIISGGGGVVLKEENRRLLKEKAVCVRLLVSPETAFLRINGDANRPNASGKSLAEIVKLMESREALYTAAAAVTVDTDEKTPEETAREILNYMQK